MTILRDLPWEVIAWLTGINARAASQAYNGAADAVDADFVSLSNDQRRALEQANPKIGALRRAAQRTWAITFALQFAIVIAIAGMALMA